MRNEMESASGGKNNLLITLVIAIIVGAIAFFGGMKYQQSKQPSRTDFQAMRERRNGNMPGGAQRPEGTQAIRGEIIEKDEETVTVKLPDESTKIIVISENTEINKATKGSVDDLKTGEQVMVFGQKNSDESISATQIQLNFDIKRGE